VKHAQKILGSGARSAQQVAESFEAKQTGSRFSSVCGIGANDAVLSFVPAIAAVRGDYFDSVLSRLSI
jgi:hypothetical protein